MTDLTKFHKKVLSQQGQDGVLEEIFRVIGTTDKFFVEFGSSGRRDGQGNTPYLRDLGFTGLLMNAMESGYSTEKEEKDYDLKVEFVKASTVNSIFEKYGVPYEFDFLSIDIDGQDFHVWNVLNYRPRVVSVESNYSIFPDYDVVMKYDENYVWDASYRSGASILALQRLGENKGYDLVAYAGADCIFVRKDIAKEHEFIHANDCVTLWNANVEMGTGDYQPFVKEIIADSSFFFPSATFM